MAKRSTKSKAPPPQRNSRDRVLDAALALSEREGWSKASLAAIAAEAELPLAEVYAEFHSRPAILAGLMARIDAAVLAGAAAPDAEEGPRERLFETLMRRFDAMKSQRLALRRIARGLSCDPLVAVLSGPALLRSMAWMLEASGVSTVGPAGRLRVKGLTVLYLDVLRTFLGDETPDLAKTMAALDRRLRQTEQCLGMVRRRGRPTAAAA
jgi:AcrR family transcriptional regulator